MLKSFQSYKIYYTKVFILGDYVYNSLIKIVYLLPHGDLYTAELQVNPIHTRVIIHIR